MYFVEDLYLSEESSSFQSVSSPSALSDFSGSTPCYTNASIDADDEISLDSEEGLLR